MKEGFIKYANCSIYVNTNGALAVSSNSKGVKWAEEVFDWLSTLI